MHYFLLVCPRCSWCCRLVVAPHHLSWNFKHFQLSLIRMLHISERAEELKLNLKLPAWVWLESPLSYQKNAGKIKNEAQAAMAMAMAKWISRALAFVKVFAARLECPFAKSSAGCSQSVIQTAPAASSPVCVSLKSIKMLQIKLKVSTFFAPPPHLSFFLTFVCSLSRVSARIGTWIRMRMRAWIRIHTQIQIPLRFGFGFICMRNIFKWQLQIFLLHTSLLSSTFASFPFAGNYFLISSLIAGVTPSLSLWLACNCR